MLLADRMGVPPHELLGYAYIPAWMAEDYALVLEAETAAHEREMRQWRRKSSPS